MKLYTEHARPVSKNYVRGYQIEASVASRAWCLTKGRSRHRLIMAVGADNLGDGKCLPGLAWCVLILSPSALHARSRRYILVYKEDDSMPFDGVEVSPGRLRNRTV